MKSSILFLLALFTSQSDAFSTPLNPSQISAARSETRLYNQESSRLEFLRQAFTIGTVTTGALLLDTQPSSAASTSDPFALPSYSDAVRNKAVEMNLDDVNKKIMDDAAARRDDRNVNKQNNDAYIQLKAEEAEEEKRLIRMREFAKKEREERIAQEKAETKANRWNTF
jgi:hypothetical protein